MDIISTWVHIDGEGEESKFPQVSGKSSNLEFQRVYWECMVVFFSTSLRFNKEKTHFLFTNTENIPQIEGFNVKGFLEENGIEIIKVTNKFKVPIGYYESWNNQFYEFSILDYLSKNIEKDYRLLLLDSDCVFNAPVDSWFRTLEDSEHCAFTYSIDYPETYDINGLNRTEMQHIFKDLGLKCESPPTYSGGEVLFAKSGFIKNVTKDFEGLWSDLLYRFENRNIKFNEEAHTLSYYYYKYNAGIGILNDKIKRCWTNPLIYRNISKKDVHLAILHLPSEKKVGIRKIYKMIKKDSLRLQNLGEVAYEKLIIGILSPNKYYFQSKNVLGFIFRNLKKLVGKA